MVLPEDIALYTLKEKPNEHHFDTHWLTLFINFNTFEDIQAG